MLALEKSLIRSTRSIAFVLTLATVLLAASATPARGDITAFIGLTPTPERHTLKGFSAGLGLIIVALGVPVYYAWRRFAGQPASR